MYIVVSIFDRCMLISFVAPSNLYRDTRPFTLYNGTFPVCPQQRTGACKCHVIVVVFRLRVQKFTPAVLRLFATQRGITIHLELKYQRFLKLTVGLVLFICYFTSYKTIYVNCSLIHWRGKK